MPHDEDMPIGWLWAKGSQHGTWFDGNITIGGETIKIVIFQIKNPKKEKSPTHYIKIKKPKEPRQEPQQQELPEPEPENPMDVPF